MMLKGATVVALAVGSLAPLGCGGAAEPRSNDDSAADGGEPSKVRGGSEAAGGATEGDDGEPATPTAPMPSAEEIAAEIERIAGTSYVVREGDPGTWGCGSSLEAEVPAFIEATLSFQKNEDSELELLSSVHYPWLRVSRSVLHREAAGWVAAEAVALGGCMAHVFEEEVEDVWSTPDELRLSFAGADSHGQPTVITVAAHFAATSSEEYSREAVDLVDQGKRDTQAPKLWHAPEYEHWDLDFGGQSRDWAPVLEEPFTPRVFQFTELLRPEWSVEVEDPNGERWPIADGAAAQGDTKAVRLDRYFPQGSRWIVDGRDLAGNALIADDTFTKELSQLDGSFEGDAQVWSLSNHEAYDLVTLTNECEPNDSRDCRATALPGHPGVDAIEGINSAWLSAGRTFLRIARAEAATTLRFRARSVDERLDWQSLEVALMSLDIGAKLERKSRRFEDWVPDAALEEESTQKVSELRDIEVTLPPGEGDVLVVLDSVSGLWLDALRTE